MDIEQQMDETPPPEGSVDEAAAKIAAIKAPEPAVELPEPELQPMSEEETENLVQQDRRRELEDYRLRLTHEQQRLAQREQEIANLREYDPAEYSAARWDFEAERQAFNNAVAQFQAATNEIQNEDLKKAQQHLLNEKKLLESKIPGGWNAEKEAKLTKYLLRQGYSREQITSVTDHKLVVAFWQQMERAGKKVLPKKAPPKPRGNAHNDPALLSDLQRRGVGKDTILGASERIARILGG